MRFLVGVDDTDSSRGYCTTYLAYRIASDLDPEVRVCAYPRLVRLNPNIPFKTRGNAAVCLTLEGDNPDTVFQSLSEKVKELSDVSGGANSGMVFLDDPSKAEGFRGLYQDALAAVVSPHRVRKLIEGLGGRTLELGNGMGIVGAAASLGFDCHSDHTYELIGYRRRENWGTKRLIDSSSVKKMDARLFPHAFNSYDYQKRKVLVAPHGPDPVFVGIRGDSPSSVIRGFGMLRYDEPLEGYMVYISNQHTDAHVQRALDWKVYSSGWVDGTVDQVSVGEGGHVYITIIDRGRRRSVAAYEPTGDLRRSAKLLGKGDTVRVSGGVRRATARHPKVLNLEKLEVRCTQGRLETGVYISSPRANRHLTKPLIRYGLEVYGEAKPVDGWCSAMPFL
ncbi:MAG: DUF1743 domain-containing protein [Nitrososphaerota archaeon]|jgi:tRNA(Ile2)-agmatinylcytidine synthase|nr:tRNA(Ile)(2)-agmatinylcytidine synthase [Nitrososphaerota archaeon]MDG6903324.1 DUF1743 domain-containing protein [Nitrososphaerota archaeon]MDG6911814.1 DUF1743 domain-containing protein [Nitrososphaerota archaeon]MDG6961014.1 DUF1743 domain-containing protein [Nitrososphaerota archaeon]MDG6963112.1 DUF1743 domain-containing protein [Nitrososphaerota archaeon]